MLWLVWLIDEGYFCPLFVFGGGGGERIKWTGLLGDSRKLGEYMLDLNLDTFAFGRVGWWLDDLNGLY